MKSQSSYMTLKRENLRRLLNFEKFKVQGNDEKLEKYVSGYRKMIRKWKSITNRNLYNKIWDMGKNFSTLCYTECICYKHAYLL